MSKFFRYIYTFWILLLPVALNANHSIDEVIHDAEYIVCVDGGGSKTALQILDRNGSPLILHQGIQESHLLQGDCSNVITVGQEGVKRVLEGLFKGLKVGPHKEKMSSVISKAAFLGGFAGAGREAQVQLVQEVLTDMGFQSDKISIYSDAALALELVGDKGAILISGTGSICFLKDGHTVRRFGGLGHRIGDDGSGYRLGLNAIKACIQEEYHYGRETSLTPLIKEIFQVNSMLDLIGPINGNSESPGKIASVAPLAFSEAWRGDSVAYDLVKETANELGGLLASAVEITQMKHCLTYLIGGLFQNENSNLFVQLLCQAPAMQKLRKGMRPLLVNMSEKMIPTLVVQEKLRVALDDNYKMLTTLPIVEEHFIEDTEIHYNKEFLTAELSDKSTRELSHLFNQNHLKGLKLLQDLDYNVLNGARSFVEKDYEKLTKKIVKKLQQGEKIYLVGSGTNGRIAIDLAAKWKNFMKKSPLPKQQNLIHCVEGIIAGGAQCLVRAQENVRDSELEGYRIVRDLNLENDKDALLVLLATNSSDFYIGALKAATELKVETFFFYNAQEISNKSKDFFKLPKVLPIALDIGPQTISESTRLQTATLSELTLGLMFNDAISVLRGDFHAVSSSRAYEMIACLENSWNKVKQNLSDIEELVNLEIDIFSDPDSNFWKALDESYQGYVTFLAFDDTLRDIMIDITDAPICFSSNPPRNKLELGKKKAEYRGYLLSDKENLSAWESVLAKEIHPLEKESLSNFLVTTKEQGYGDYIGRTVGHKNLVIGVLKTTTDSADVLKLALELNKIKDRGLKTAIIVIGDEHQPLDQALTSYLNLCDASVFIDKVPEDALGMIKSLTLKQVLNLLSNGAMIGMNKVYGNVMIDLSPSNQKLLERSIGIIQQIYHEHHPDQPYFDPQLLYQYVVRVLRYKNLAEMQLGKHIPPPTKVVLTMLEKKCDVESAVSLLKINHENIDLVFNPI